MTIKFLSYDEWIKNNPEFNIDEKCESCYGTGKSECGICDCGDCNGKGKINTGIIAYWKQLEVDKKKVDKFIKKQEVYD